jgi:hypothetical protein
LITLQEIEIAKSGVLAKKGRLSPTVSAGIGAGLKKQAVTRVKEQEMLLRRWNPESQYQILWEILKQV